ncbi:hypothetical protein F4604DRAFT_1676468 [Suillus subluteus]|nr:hypothetical protein F4604DRAFT_1676468 [Suillus subluteus]
MQPSLDLCEQQPEKPTVVPPPARPPMKRDIAMNESDDETRFLLDILSDQPEPTVPTPYPNSRNPTAGAYGTHAPLIWNFIYINEQGAGSESTEGPAPRVQLSETLEWCVPACREQGKKW